MIATADTTIEIPTIPGQEIHASALGTFGGATVTLQTYVDGAYYAVPDGVFTAAFEVVRTNGKGTLSRLVVTGSTGTTSLSLNLASIP